MSRQRLLRSCGCLIILAVLAGCTSPASDQPASPTGLVAPATSPPAARTVAPSPTPPDPGAAFLADITSSEFTARIVLSGQITPAGGGSVGQIDVTIDVIGQNMHAAAKWTNQGQAPVAHEEISIKGIALLRTGDGPWVRDEASLTSRVPSLASAFASVTRTHSIESTTCAGVTSAGLRADALDVGVFMAALGLVDAGVTGSSGSAAFCLGPDGTTAGFVVEWAGSPSREDTSVRVTESLSATVSRTTVGPVAQPDTWWLRDSQTHPAFSGIYPSDWTWGLMSSSDDMSTFCYVATDGSNDEICVMQVPSVWKTAAAAQIAFRDQMRKQTGTAPVIDEKTTVDGQATHLWTFRFTDSKGKWVVHMTAVVESGQAVCIWSNSVAADEKAIRGRFIDFLSEYHVTS
jgi:hypothetical protein